MEHDFCFRKICKEQMIKRICLKFLRNLYLYIDFDNIYRNNACNNVIAFTPCKGQEIKRICLVSMYNLCKQSYSSKKEVSMSMNMYAETNKIDKEMHVQM